MTVTTWQVVALEDYPGDLWSDWQQLAIRHHATNPMLDAQFARLLVQYFGTRLHVLIGKRDENAVMLALVESASHGRWQGFRPSQAQAALIVCSSDCEVVPGAIVAAFPSLCLRLDLFALDPREHEPFLHDWRCVQRLPSVRNICVELHGTFDDYWQQRPRNLRKNIRRYRSRLGDEVGEVRLRVASDRSSVISATDRYGIMESRGWKGRIGTALHPGNLQGQFYRDFMASMAEQGRAFVFELYAGDRLLASRLCVTGADILVILKTTFDEDLKRYAVGRQLLYELLNYLYDSRLVGVVDFYTDASRDQMDWATTDRSMQHDSVYPSVNTMRAYSAAKQVVGWMARAKGSVC
ncbi:MAG: GNAT family N-acetyltransferase [Halieaceae bacterium]|nr:GNAT family N-acetyltransferase [Halieaceae bacterium]